jgi:hypothetical protein
MIAAVIKWALGPLTKIGEKALDTYGDVKRVEAGVDKVAIEADAKFRALALEHPAFSIPFAILYISHALYAASIPLDSFVFTNGWFAPLELPKWYQEYFGLVMISLTGLGAFIVKRRKD